jgi:hypothetical protein
MQLIQAAPQRLPDSHFVAQAAEQLHLPLGVGAVGVEIGGERLFLDRLYLLLLGSQVKDAPCFRRHGAEGLRCVCGYHSCIHDMQVGALPSSAPAALMVKDGGAVDREAYAELYCVFARFAVDAERVIISRLARDDELQRHQLAEQETKRSEGV